MATTKDDRYEQLFNAQLEIRSLRIFIMYASLAAALCVAGGFLGVAIKDRDLIRQEMLERARGDFAGIFRMWHWNAQYNGVYVEQKPDFFPPPGHEPTDITATNGKVYTLKNPAVMTRELSELPEKDMGYTFHITSLNPTNPSNQPDPEEARALMAFEKGSREESWTQTIKNKAYYRYMVPLQTDKSCLDCHSNATNTVGAVRGGISISYNVEELTRRLRTNLLDIVALAILTTMLLLGSLYVLFRRMVVRLHEAQDQLITLATTDALTELLNRRYILQRLEDEMARHDRNGESLGCIVLDVDFFKQVNDRFGHAAGDDVLRQLASHVKSTLRPYDLVGRVGGEEFLVILPETDFETLREVAERLRLNLAQHLRAGPPDSPQPVTVSLGITSYRRGEDCNDLLNRADRAMYTAKKMGRNRVGEAEGPPQAGSSGMQS